MKGDMMEDESPEMSMTEKTEISNLVKEDHGRSTILAYCLDRRLIFNKIFYLSFFGALGCVLPYWAIYFKQMGFSPQQIGLIFGLRPIAGFISGPVWGMVADRFRIRRLLFLISIAAWIAMIVTLGMLPAPGRAESCPRRLIPHRGATSRVIYPPDSPLTTNVSDTVTVVDPSLHLNQHQVAILKESIGWVYRRSDINHLLVAVALLVLGGELVQSPTGAFADASTLHTLGEDGREGYGTQRAWGALGWGISSFGAGALISQSRTPEVVCGIPLHFSDYRNFVYVFLAVVTFGVISATQINFESKNSEDRVEKEKTAVDLKEDSAGSSEGSKPVHSHSTLAVLRVFTNLHYGSWLFCVFFAGMCNGCIWGFLFWHLENLGADQLLMGVANLVTCSSEFVMFFFADVVIKKIGHTSVFYIGFVCYIIRLVVYAQLVNPWWVVLVELLQGWTFSCMLTSMATYSAQAVPYVSLTAIQGIFQGVYFGVGVGSGKLIAGLLIGYYGAVFTFYMFAISCGVVLVLFSIAQKCGTKPETRDFFYQDMGKSDENVTNDK